LAFSKVPILELGYDGGGVWNMDIDGYHPYVDEIDQLRTGV
jgi:hypothetical protein